MSSDSIPICRRQSRQDEYHRAVNRETTNNTTSRSLSRVRFRTSTETNPQSSLSQMKSILKKVSSNYSILPRTSSVDRDIARLTSVKQRRNSFYKSDDADEENLSDQSTTDSCLGSLSSDENSSYVITQHQLETLV
jgi:hypothetical protein